MASSFCTSIVVALDTADADAIVGYLCMNHIETLVEIAQHAKFAPIIAAVTAKLGIGMKFIGLQSLKSFAPNAISCAPNWPRCAAPK